MQGGHDSEFVYEVPDRFICQICCKVLRKPHLTVCCGQHFCESCLNGWFNRHRKQSCPHCRAEGKEFSHVINKGLRNEINQLKVICSNHDKGCKWMGELGALKTHLESDKGCGFVEVKQYQCEHRGHEDIITGKGTGIKYWSNVFWFDMHVTSHCDDCPEFSLS